MNRFVLALTIAAAIGAAGCLSETSSDKDSKPTSGTTVDSLAPELWVDAAPGGAKPLSQVKSVLKEGDDVTLRVRVGGTMKPFVDGLAVMQVVDPSLSSCKELHEDECATPWDYCCEPKDSLVAHSATIQVTGADGAPLAGTFENSNGLKELDHVIVVGKVSEMQGSSLVVDAKSMYREVN